MKDMKDMKVVNITTSCSPVSTGYIANGGWNWSYPAIGKVAGTAGNLERWATGHKEKWESLKDSHEEEKYVWDSLDSTRESAWEWLDSQAS